MRDFVNIPVIKFSENAKLPTYADPYDAGADLYSVEYGVLEPGERRLIDTGIGFEIPHGYVGLIHPRSGLAHKFGVTIVNAPGTIDSGYRGAVKVNLYNSSSMPYSYCLEDRIAQIVFQKYSTAQFTEVSNLSESTRGAAGHGSTGGFNG